jgi:hypothetical protein
LTRILIFIDESGNPWAGETTFVGAAIWCVPITREGFQSTMRYTLEQSRLKIAELTGKMPNEVHYSDGLWRYSKEIIQTVGQKTLEDNSIVRKEFLWARYPVASTVAVFNPKIEYAISPNVDFPNVLRARTIATLLMPLLNYQGASSIDVSIILDSDCWKKGLTYCTSKLEEMCKATDITISFSCESSSRVPGLQIADLFAGVTRDYHKDGTMQETYELSTKHRINHIGKWSPEPAINRTRK